MRPKAITELAFKHKMFSDAIAGRTPHQTMKSKLSVHVRRLGKSSIFVRTEAGHFFLRDLLDEHQDEYSPPRLGKPHGSENVLVFPQSVLPPEHRFQGIRRDWRFYTRALSSFPLAAKDRLQAESSNDIKQLLTYILIGDGKRLLLFRRGSYTHADRSLQGSLCVGFGGHISSEDLDLFDPTRMGIFNCAVRELNEELRLPEIDKRRLANRKGLKIIGSLNDDSSEVGLRHFAFVLRYEPSSDPWWDHPERGEKSITQLHWVTRESKIYRIWDFEYWSQLCLREFHPGLVATEAAYRIRRKRPFRGPHILCLIGKVGSGKSQVAKVLEEKFGYAVVNSGRVLAELIGLEPVPATPRGRFQEAALAFIRRENGPAELATEIFSHVKSTGSQAVAVDGLRHVATFDALRRAARGWSLPVVFVHSLPDVALEMVAIREAPGVDFSEYLQQVGHAVESDIDEFLERADAIVYNWRGREDLAKVVRSLILECRPLRFCA